MTLPGLYFALLISTGLGLIFHFVRGGGLARLALYLVTAWVAFLAGQVVADLLDWHLFRVGPLNLFAAVMAALLGLFPRHSWQGQSAAGGLPAGIGSRGRPASMLESRVRWR